MPERELVERISRLEPLPFDGRVVRHISPGYLPLSGEGARIHGGRWNPPDSFAVLYTALSPETMLEELTRAARRQGLTVGDMLPRTEVVYDVRLQRVLDLREHDACEAIGLSPDDITGRDWSKCQAVGEAARHMGFEGILASSATLAGPVLAIFLDRIVLGSTLDVRSSVPLTQV